MKHMNELETGGTVPPGRATHTTRRPIPYGWRVLIYAAAQAAWLALGIALWIWIWPPMAVVTAILGGLGLIRNMREVWPMRAPAK
jgi:hypothetical protein